MASIRSQIIDHLVAALSADSHPLPGGGELERPDGFVCHRFRIRNYKDLPAGGVFPGSFGEDDPTAERCQPYSMGGVVLRTFRVVVEVATKTTESDLEEALDPYLRWAVVSVMADPKRGGLALDTDEVATGWDGEDKHELICFGTAVSDIQYLTLAGDPWSQPTNL